MIGTVIGGDYQVESIIGEGGFGVVYRCREVHLERPVAIKVLGRVKEIGEKELQKFLSEARILASINHPNVVQIYRLGTHEGLHYIVMEYLRGRTLRDLLREGRPPLRRGLEILRGVAHGLTAIHERAIVHRDLSSNNVMILETGDVKILDLGLARETLGTATLSADTILAGTIPYISPEQIGGETATAASDMFSLGVLLYQVVTGHKPFDAEHYMSALYNIANREPEPLESYVESVPPALSDLIDACLRKRPEERLSSAVEAESRLGEILATQDLDGVHSLDHDLPVHAIRDSVKNPYLNRVMLKRREDFFGREQEVKRIYSRLNTTPPGSVSIVGDRKVGKSSLLNHIYLRRNRETYLEYPDKMVMVFLDLQSKREMSVEVFVRELIGMADQELRGRLDLTGCPTSLDGIKDLVQRLDKTGYRLTIMLDEFETITINPSFGLEFFSFLRYLANHYNVAYLTSSARDLQVLCHTKEISDSPFFNIFTNLRLTAFKREEAMRLICEPSAKVGKPLESLAESIIDMAGLLPLFLQIACAHVLEYLDENPDTGKGIDLGEVRRRFLEEAGPHFHYIWESFDPDQRTGVTRIAMQKGIPDSLRHVIDDLARRGYVVADGTKERLFSSCFQDFVRQEAAHEKSGSRLSRLFRGR